jgi:hypothetical protein
LAEISKFWPENSWLYLVDTSHPMEELPQETVILGTAMGTSSLNVYGHNSALKKRIKTIDSTKCASREIHNLQSEKV